MREAFEAGVVADAGPAAGEGISFGGDWEGCPAGGTEAEVAAGGGDLELQPGLEAGAAGLIKGELQVAAGPIEQVQR